MRGHVRRRGSSWTVVYDEPSDNGKRRQRSKGGFPTKRDAQRFLNETLQRLDTGSYAAPTKQTLGDYLEQEWLPATAGTLRPSSATRYAQTVRAEIVPQIGSQRLQTLSGGHLNSMYADLERTGLSVSTRRLAHAVIHRALRDAIRWGKLTRNAAAMADPPSRSRTRANAWTASELRRFLDHVRDDRLFALWRLAATTGMRRGELAGLGWRHLDLDGGRLSVEQQLAPDCTLGPPKSARGHRTVALDPETVGALRRHRDTQLLERDFAGDAYVDAGLGVLRRARRPDPSAAVDEAVRRTAQCRRHPGRDVAHASPYGRDVDAHVRGAGAYRGGPAGRPGGDGALDLCASVAAVG
jgi:integrase